jgi:hypothetical protein
MPPVEPFQFRESEYKSGAATLNTRDAIYDFKTVEWPKVPGKALVTTWAGSVPCLNARNGVVG